MGLKTSYNNHTTTYLIIGAILLAGIGYYIYIEGKKSVPPAQAPLPPDLDPNNSSASDSNASLSSLAQQLYSDLAPGSISWFADHDEDIYNNAMALSNTAFVQLYNVYNALYQTSSSETLTQAVKACDAIPLSAWATTQQAFLDRLASLNLQ